MCENPFPLREVVNAMNLRVGASVLLMMVSTYSFAGVELFKCREEIDMSDCEIKGHIGTCTYTNRSAADLSASIRAYS